MNEIILVEDDVDDIYFFKLACEQITPKPSLVILHDGTELLDYLTEVNCVGKVILLDLNMPKMGGLEVLKQLKKIEKLNQLIIIVYTTSDHSEDIKAAYQLGVKSYLTKPDNIEQLITLLTAICDYWFSNNLTLKEAK